MRKNEKKERVLKEFGARIKIIRVEKGYTQAKLAHRVGMTRTSVVNLEAGRQHPNLWRILQLAEALEIKVEELFVPFQEWNATEEVERNNPRLPTGPKTSA